MEGESPDSSKKDESPKDNLENQPSSSNQDSSEERPSKLARRNYRRRTDSSSSDEVLMDIESRPGITTTSTPDVLQQVPVAADVGSNHGEEEAMVDIEDVPETSDNNNQDSDNSSESDSDFSFDSPLSPLLRFGLGNRRLFGPSDSDSDSTEYDEEVREKANKITTEIMGKHPATHDVSKFSWPKIFLNRERGYFCKQNEARYMNHRKVFERNFYGSLYFSVERLELMSKLDEHFGCVNCLGFSKNGLYLLSGSDDLRVILWNWYNQKPVTMANSKHKKNIFQTKFYEESSMVMKVVSAAADGSISMHQFTNDGGHTEKQIYTHAGAVHKVAITENTILSCGEDGLIIEYDVRHKSPTKLITVREKHRKIPLFSITAHPTEYKYAISGRDQFVRVYDRRNEKVVYARHCPQDLLERNTSLRYISCCVYNYNGTELLASFNDENIYLFDSSDHRLGSFKHKYQGHINSATIKGVNFYGPKSEFIVTGSDCSHIFFYEKESESIVQFMQGDENGIVNVLEPHPIYPILATSGLDKDIKIWMPSNENFELNKEDLKKCVGENMKNLYESSNNATFSVDPAILELARRFFQRQREASPNPLAIFNTNSSSSDSD